MQQTKNTSNAQNVSDIMAATVEQFLALNGYHSLTEIAEMGQMSRQEVVQCLLNKYGSAILQTPLTH